MTNIGLFAGIGGIEYGLQKNGFETQLFCEIMTEAQIVLNKHFPNVPLHSDIKTLRSVPKVDMISAGFPCQDLSIAGKKKGILGLNSSLVGEVFRLIKSVKRDSPNFLLIENVPYLLSLNGGEAIKFITETIYSLGYNWAYRIIDPRGFGVPQRRPRIIFLASKIIHPKDLLFSENDLEDQHFNDKLIIEKEHDYGFYWTEGRIGIGWAKNSLPPIKGGSSIGIPSPPAIWIQDKNLFGTPTLQDAERLQGFPANWTNEIEMNNFKRGLRWKLVGNAVNTYVSNWVGKRISDNVSLGPKKENVYKPKGNRWPEAAYNEVNQVYAVKASRFTDDQSLTPIAKFLQDPVKPLSYKATSGFFKRAQESTLIKYPLEFLTSLENYIATYAK